MAHQPTIRVINILELLSGSREGLTLTEISRFIGSGTSTISPIIKTLAQRNFIFLDKKSRRYHIGLTSYCVGVNYIPDKTAYQFITAEMEHVAAQTSEICQMGILDQGQVFYIAKVDSKEDIRIASFVGKRLPAYCTALGKAMLSSKTTAELQALYPNGLTPCTQHTVTGFSELERQLQTVNVCGYAYEKGETTDQIECFAVPLCKNKVIFAAISVSVPSFRATTEKNELICSILMQTRSRIEDYINTNDIAIDTLLLQ